MRKIRFCAAILLLFIIMPITALAVDVYVFDSSGKLKGPDLSIIEQNCEWLADQDFGLAIYIDGSDAEGYANEWESDSGLGGGTVFCVDTASGTVDAAPFGAAEYIFTGSVIADIESIAAGRLSAEGAADCCQSIVMNVVNVIHDDELVRDSFYREPLTDNAGFLSDEEYDRISKRLDSIRRKYNVDVIVYTQDVMSGTNAEQTADDIYDYGLFGAGRNDDGIILYVSRDPRKYHFSTHADGLRIFNDNGLIYMEDKVLPHLKDNDYAGAFNAYADAAEYLLETAANGKPYNKKSGHINIEYLLAALLLPVVIAAISTSSQLKKMNTAVDNNYADSYVKKGSFVLRRSDDIYLYSTITKTKRESSSSSGSSSHRSSSGRSHGGRGGSY